MPAYSLGNEFLFIFLKKVFPAVLTTLPTRRYNIISEKIWSIHCMSVQHTFCAFNFQFLDANRYSLRAHNLLSSFCTRSYRWKTNKLIYYLLVCGTIAQHSIHNHCTRDIAWPSNYPLTWCVIPNHKSYIITLKYIHIGTQHWIRYWPRWNIHF